MVRPQAVIFDLDGTLLDSLEDLADSMNHVLAAAGLPTHAVAAYRFFVGDGVEMLVRRAAPEERADTATLARLAIAMREEYDRRATSKTRPYPGIPELLDELSARGLPVAILSNKPHDATRHVVARLLPRWRFAAVQGVLPEIPRKPDPAGALALAARLHLAPGEVLYVGDTDTDMRTARAAGMRAVGVLWGFRPGAELTAAGAQFLVATPADILPLLGPRS